MDGFATRIFLLVGVQYDEGCGQFDQALIAVSNSRAAANMAAEISVMGWNATQKRPATGSDSPKDVIIQYNLPNYWVEIQEIPLYESETYCRPKTNRGATVPKEAQAG